MLKQFCFVALLLAGLLTNLAYGQGGTTGAISGLVTDSQGAVVVEADVKATQITTGVVSNTKTNIAGVYTFPYLPFGQYEVRISAQGMKEAVVTGVTVDEANISRVDAKLEVGTANETVKVTASAPLIEQESTTIDGSVDRKLIEDLPSVAGGGTRAASDVLQILPGVQTPGASSGNSYGSQFGVNVGGGRQFATEWQMDGMALAYQGVTGSVPLDMRPDYDVTSEAKVQEGVPSAEFGRTSSGVVTFLSRSGSNQFHGDAGVFIKNQMFDAHPYNTATVTTDQNWEMPLSVGGPILIPKIWDGRKHKSFFFFDYTAYRQKSAAVPGTVTVPTAMERTGVFTDQPNIIYDPTTGQPFLNNTIPQGRFSSIATAVNAFYPVPTNTNLSANLTGATPQDDLENDQFARVDQQIGSNNHLMASYRHRNEPAIYAEDGPFGPSLSGDTSPRSLHEDTVQDDWTITPHIVNHIAVADIGFTTAQISNPNDPKYWVPVPGSFGPDFPDFCFTTQNYSGLGMGLSTSTQTGCNPMSVNFEIDRTRDVQDTVFWNKDAHSIKIGARYMWFQAASGSTGGENGYYQFNGAETAQVVKGVPQTATTGNSYASFLLGLVDSAGMVLPDVPDFHAQNLGLYAQDDWRASKSLSLSFGLRWDIQPPDYDTQNRLSAMSPTTPNPAAGNLPGAYVFAPQQGVRSFQPTYYGAWAPRFGAAYSLRPDLGWGTALEDFDNDGWPDIVMITGSIYPEVAARFPDWPYRTPRLFYRNLRNGKFELIDDAGPGITASHSSRGMAFGDFDNDGDLDLLIMNMNEPPSLLRNDVQGDSMWMKIFLVGTKSNRSAIGARVVAYYGQKRQAKTVTAQASFYSSSDRRLHFGLGNAAMADVEIFWPNGGVEKHRSLPANHLVTIKEGTGVTKLEKWKSGGRP